MAATATEPKKADNTAALLSLLGENEVPLSEVTAVAPAEFLGRAWAAGDIEFGHSKYIMTNAPGGDPATAVQRVGPTLVMEGGVEWSGAKKPYHGRVKDILKSTALPAATYYQRYQQEFCVNKAKDVWEWVEADTDVAGREVRWVRRDCSKKDAESLFGWYVKLTDKGLAQLQAE